MFVCLVSFALMCLDYVGFVSNCVLTIGGWWRMYAVALCVDCVAMVVTGYGKAGSLVMLLLLLGMGGLDAGWFWLGIVVIIACICCTVVWVVLVFLWGSLGRLSLWVLGDFFVCFY